MSNELIEKIIEGTSILIDSRIVEIGRSGNMLWLHFDVGSISAENNFSYALHISTAWRIVDEEKIIVGDADFYMPPSGEYIKDFYWQKAESNRFDMKARSINETLNQKTVKVTRVTADIYGGIKILFSYKHCLEIFPNDSLMEEYWRLFKMNDLSSHFVIIKED